MRTKYKYILEPYKGSASRHICPACHKREFVRYINTETGLYADDKAGRCNREIKCGYHLKPNDYLKSNRLLSNDNNIHTEPSYIPAEILMCSVKISFETLRQNNFLWWLNELFPKTEDIITRHEIGSTTDGRTVFWQIDINGNIRSGKLIKFDSDGHRDKDVKISWIHSELNLKPFNLHQCFFNEYLLRKNNKPAAIVESEKTAIIASIYLPQYIWLASGGLSNLNYDKCRVLKFRQVVLFPDLCAHDKWQSKAKELSQAGLNVTVSDFIENVSTGYEHSMGYDIADYLCEQNINYEGE